VHGRPCHRFRDSLGIAHIVFVRLHVGLDKLGRHAFDLVYLVAPLACPVMGSATGLHADGHQGQLRHKGYQSMARQPLAPPKLSRGVSPHEVGDFFGQIDADGVHILLHWTRLLAVTCWSLALTSLWLIKAAPHRGGSISLTPESRMHPG
jgi:hypothetical protein